MIHEGTDLKFRVILCADGFEQSADPWLVEVVNQSGLRVGAFHRGNCLTDGAGGWYVVLESVAAGMYRAVTSADVPDADYEDGFMRLTDVQPLCTVGIKGYARPPRSEGTPLSVRFERVLTRNVSGRSYLADESGGYILDSRGERVELSRAESGSSPAYRLPVSGRELEAMLMGGGGNGRVDSLRELIDAFQGVEEQDRLTDMMAGETLSEEEINLLCQ